MADAEESDARRMAARSKRVPRLWIAALSYISRDLAQRRLPPDFQSPLPRPRDGLFLQMRLRDFEHVSRRRNPRECEQEEAKGRGKDECPDL